MLYYIVTLTEIQYDNGLDNKSIEHVLIKKTKIEERGTV
jgi:hypothetical protein